MWICFYLKGVKSYDSWHVKLERLNAFKQTYCNIICHFSMITLLFWYISTPVRYIGAGLFVKCLAHTKEAHYQLDILPWGAWITRFAISIICKSSCRMKPFLCIRPGISQVSLLRCFYDKYLSSNKHFHHFPVIFFLILQRENYVCDSHVKKRRVRYSYFLLITGPGI